MPLPYVRTERALKGFMPTTGYGITPEDCADRMIRGIPLGKMWYFVDWSTFVITRLYPMMPNFFDACIRVFVRKISRHYKEL